MFSNHSQKFNPSTSTPPIGSSSTTTTTPTTAPPKLRTVPSKHFSTKLSEEKSTSSDQLSSVPHPLKHTWVFWFQHRTPGSKNTDYEQGIKRVSAFSSVESYWSLWTHLTPPSSLQPTTDYLLFHQGVKRPIWEDPLNANGGKWIIRLRKGVADRLWENLVLAVVGDQFTPERNSKAEGSDDEAPLDWASDEICGCTISVRSNEDILAVWNKNGSDAKIRVRIRDTIRRVLGLGQATTMEYKSNNDSMQDKSSFRTLSGLERG